MKKQTLTVAAAAVATLGWISTALAQGPGEHMRRPGGPGGEPGGPPPIERIAERLGLSDEQKAQWKEIHEKSRETGEPLMKAAGEARRGFDKALNAENADAATVGQAALAMKTAQDRVADHHKETQAAVKATLNPEQLAKFEEMEKRMRRRGPDGQGPRRRPAPEGSK
jgi:protein CpxP